MKSNRGRRVLSDGKRLDRRSFVKGTSLLIATPAVLRGLRSDAEEPCSELFPLGVASGDPTSHSVVLWTRLAPEPLNGGGMPDKPVRVWWEVATDANMSDVVKRGFTIALPGNGHAAHVVVSGLPSNCWFYYRFSALGERSRIGRTRTFPGPRDDAPSLRFALVSCQSYVQGFWPAWADIAQQDLDCVVHVGDYIYEYGQTATPIAPDRNHDGPAVFSVEDYRNRYALYRLDANLQDAHARFPFIVTWDDHEVDNNYAGLIAAETAPYQGEAFLQRRNNAYQVYVESMPLGTRNRVLTDDGRVQLFRKLSFGNLADFHVLDTRQFRTDQPAEDGFGSTDPDSAGLLEGVLGERLFDAEGILNPNASMLGDKQLQWLVRNLLRSQATWNILAQGIMLTEWNLVGTIRAGIQFDPTIPPPLKTAILNQVDQVDNIFSVDAWDGYQAARAGLLEVLRFSNNPVVLTGDIHSAWGANLLNDFADQDSGIVAAEFVCTSISSKFQTLNPKPSDALVRASLPDNPHVEFFNGLFRGYCLCDVNRNRWQTIYRAAGTLADVAAADPLDPTDLTLVPFNDTPIETDAVLEVPVGFNTSDTRLQTVFRRI